MNDYVQECIGSQRDEDGICAYITEFSTCMNDDGGATRQEIMFRAEMTGRLSRRSTQ